MKSQVSSKGADQPGAVVWTTTDGDVTNKDVEQNAEGNKVFNTTYGTFTANKDGTYDFKAGVEDAAANQTLSLAEIIKGLGPQNGTTNDKVLTFKYVYTDNDGDTASSTVEINLKDYPQLSTARNFTGTAHNDSIKGTSQPDDILRGGAGDDQLEGLAGADKLYGETGDDYFIPSFVTNANANTLEDIIDGGEGHDAVLLYSQYYLGDKVGEVLENANFDTDSLLKMRVILKSLACEQKAPKP